MNFGKSIKSKNNEYMQKMAKQEKHTDRFGPNREIYREDARLENGVTQKIEEIQSEVPFYYIQMSGDLFETIDEFEEMRVDEMGMYPDQIEQSYYDSQRQPTCDEFQTELPDDVSYVNNESDVVNHRYQYFR